MSMDDDRPPATGPLVKVDVNLKDVLPGAHLEKAAAGVVTEASNSIIRVLERTLGATTANFIAKREAEAEATRKAIETRSHTISTSE